MKKIIMLAAILISAFSAQQSFAQLKGFRIGLGLEGALPTGNFAQYYSVGGGLSARFEIRPTHKVAVNATVGALIFSPKKIDVNAAGDIKPVVNIPIKIGVKYIFIGHLYGMLEAGNTNSNVYYDDNGTLRHKSFNSFTYSAGVGVQLIGFDIGLRYETFGKDTNDASKFPRSNFTALRLGFGL